MISSKNECVLIRDLNDLTLQIIFNDWWASMNVGLIRSIARNNSRHASSSWFYLYCGIEETGSPGIICIIYHHVRRHQSEHGNSSMGKHLLPNAQIAKLNQLTESEMTKLTSWTVDETGLPILKGQASQGIRMVSSHSNFIFDIPLNPYRSIWQIKRSKLAAKDFESSDFRQDMWNRYLMLQLISTDIPWNAVTNLELWRSYIALRNVFVLPAAMTCSNICRRQSAMTMNAIKKQLPSRNTVSLALDRLTSTNKLAIQSVIAYYMDRNWALRQVQLDFDEVDRLFLSGSES